VPDNEPDADKPDADKPSSMSEQQRAEGPGEPASQKATKGQTSILEEPAVKQKELEVRNREADRALALAGAPWWRRADPLVLAIAAGVFTLFGNMIVAVYNSNATIAQEEQKAGNTLKQEKAKAKDDLDLEKQKAKYNLILQAIATNDVKVAARNIEFFIDSGALDDSDNKIRQALAKYNPVLPAGGSSAQATELTLPGLNASIGETSVSGFSSGAAMAVQFATAWSSVVKGVGLVDGTPFWCAEAEEGDAINAYMLPILQATGPCSHGPPPDPGKSIAKADEKASAREIDPTRYLARQKVYLFHGYNDAVVAKSVVDSIAAFYRHYSDTPFNLYYQTSIGAGSGLATANPAIKNKCEANGRPYINNCGYDQAGKILQHIYGALNPPNRGTLTGSVERFSQQLYSKTSTVSLSLGDTGYVFVPKDCAVGNACRVHIALHGCGQSAEDIDRFFVDGADYNAWADTNSIVVLYPQAGKSSPNPNGCWDWWSYLTHDDHYVTKAGLQIAAIKAMLDALTSGAKPVAPAPNPPAVAPATIVANDTSDSSAALAWAPVSGAAMYRVYRAGTDQTFAPVASVFGPSFADSGLAPRSTYQWRVSAVVDGVEGPPSLAIAAATLASPAPCPSPGTCPTDQTAN
jgi:hypothetical protein